MYPSALERLNQTFLEVSGFYFSNNRIRETPAWEAKQCFKGSFMADPDRVSFTSAVVEVYSSAAESDRGLRDLVVQRMRILGAAYAAIHYA
ncbi:hypothetical protein GB937_004498 [Aspergillus fischeri]|nr:hypothetical protein GB937_004498 [Aspergillus fischeri]